MKRIRISSILLVGVVLTVFGCDSVESNVVSDLPKDQMIEEYTNLMSFTVTLPVVDSPNQFSFSRSGVVDLANPKKVYWINRDSTNAYSPRLSEDGKSVFLLDFPLNTFKEIRLSEEAGVFNSALPISSSIVRFTDRLSHWSRSGRDLFYSDDQDISARVMPTKRLNIATNSAMEILSDYRVLGVFPGDTLLVRKLYTNENYLSTVDGVIIDRFVNPLLESRIDYVDFSITDSMLVYQQQFGANSIVAITDWEGTYAEIASDLSTFSSKPSWGPDKSIYFTEFKNVNGEPYSQIVKYSYQLNEREVVLVPSEFPGGQEVMLGNVVTIPKN